MQSFASGYDVTLIIPLVDLNGTAVVPVALSASAIDETGATVMGATAIPVTLPMTSVSVTVPAASNTLAAGVLTGARTVTVAITTAQGVVPATASYLVKAPLVLSVPSASFQTYEEALVESSTMSHLTGWASSSADSQKISLIEAYKRLTMLGYLVRNNENNYNVMDFMPGYNIVGEAISPRHWTDMTLSKFNSLPARFRTALKRAQIAEANEILLGVDTTGKRRLGIMSETIGESSMMFRTDKPLDVGLSSAALKHLTGYLDTRVTLTRT